jgi:diguanylate cyclase (GGDEF)-like protein
MKLVEKLQNTNKPALITGGIVMLFVVGYLDYFTGNELSFSLFYLFPIALLAWVTNIRVGIFISFISAGIWLAADIASGAKYSSEAIYFWNTTVRLGFFLLTVFFLKTGKALEHEKGISRTDYLTGAVNSRFFAEIIQQEIDRAIRYQHPLTIAFIDVDNFKSINDQFGHLVGDKVLETVVGSMRQHLRKTDTVARVGGDEFAILLPESTLDVAQITVSKMQHELLNEMRVNHWPVTFSIGVLVFNTPPISADEAINMADKLMYSVKNNGKDNISYMTVSSR